MAADIVIIRQIRRIQRIIFLGKIGKYLEVPQIVDLADGCIYSDHLADPVDPAEHVFRKNRKNLGVPQKHKIAGHADGCGYSDHSVDPADTDHVFRKNRKVSRSQAETQDSGSCT